MVFILHRRTLVKESFTKRLDWRVLKGLSEPRDNGRWRFQQVVGRAYLPQKPFVTFENEKLKRKTFKSWRTCASRVLAALDVKPSV